MPPPPGLLVTGRAKAHRIARSLSPAFRPGVIFPQRLQKITTELQSYRGQRRVSVKLCSLRLSLPAVSKPKSKKELVSSDLNKLIMHNRRRQALKFSRSDSKK